MLLIYLWEHYRSSLLLIFIKTELFIKIASKPAGITSPKGPKMGATKLGIPRLILGRFFGGCLKVSLASFFYVQQQF